MKIVKAKIEGVAPGLLQHKFADATSAGLVNNVKVASKTRLTAIEEAERAAYRLESGEICQPSEHIFQSMVKSAANFQIQGGGKKTYKDRVNGGLLIEPEYIGHGVDDYEILSVPVRIQRARVIGHRPLLRSWSLEFQMNILDEDLLPVDVLNAILVRAGQQVGIGDWRPRYGRFIVVEFKEV